LRAAECGAHADAGAPTPEQWVGQLAGIPVGRARAEMETVVALAGHAATTAAVVSGEVSLAQAAEVLHTLETVPDAEAELLEVARSKPLRSLQDRARRIRARREDSESRYRRQQLARGGSHRIDRDGMSRWEVAFTPEIGAAVRSVVEREADRLYRKASKQQRRSTPHHASVADAIANLILGRAETGFSGADVIVLVDLEALRRGHRHDGETCHIPGVGDIPVSLAREIADDAFLKAAIHDAVEPKAIRHFGRRYPAHLRTALAIGSPTDFAGTVCCEDGCERRFGLERNHVDPVANDGPTCWENLRWRCRPHHRAKTERDRRAGLLGSHPRRGSRSKRARSSHSAGARAP